MKKLIVLFALSATLVSNAGALQNLTTVGSEYELSPAEPLSKYFGKGAVGYALESENVMDALVWNVAVGKRRYLSVYPLISLENSIKFSNYYADEVIHAPDRLVPGDLGLRTFGSDNGITIRINKLVNIMLGTGIGWTWVQHKADKKVALSDLTPYDAGDKLISVSESIHDGFSFTGNLAFEIHLTKRVDLGLNAEYFFMHTSRERDVQLYDELSALPYADRYYVVHSESPVSLDHWSLLATLRF